MPQRVETGTLTGNALGFTEDLFSGWLELYEDSRVYLHYIISRHKNECHTQQLLESWLKDGYDIRVVLPRPIMKHILTKYGFESSSEFLPDHYEEEVEVWKKPPLARPQQNYSYQVPGIDEGYWKCAFVPGCPRDIRDQSDRCNNFTRLAEPGTKSPVNPWSSAHQWSGVNR